MRSSMRKKMGSRINNTDNGLTIDHIVDGGIRKHVTCLHPPAMLNLREECGKCLQTRMETGFVGAEPVQKRSTNPAPSA